MQREYFGIVDGGEGAYRIVIPDFPGCVGYGNTFVEAVADASETVAQTAASQISAGVELPAERELSAVLADFQRRTGQLRCGGVPIKIDI